MERRIKRITVGLLAGVGLMLAALPALAGGIDDFKLTRAIPADAAIAVHTRAHDGRKFVNEQFEKVWAEVEKQHFDRDVKRMLRLALVPPGDDGAAFDEKWQQITDLSAGVEWSHLWQREGAFAAKLAVPNGIEMVALLMPPEDQVQADFTGLVAVLKGLVALAPEGMLALTSDGEGEAAVHKLTFTDPMSPAGLGLTLARHHDVLLVGFGATMPQQSLALLRGDTPVEGSLAATERFKAAFKQLPSPTDGFHYVDVAALLGRVRELLQIVGPALTAPPPETSATGPATRSSAGSASATWLGAVRKFLDMLDVCEYVAGVSTTEGMKTTREAVTVLRADAKSKALYRVLYAGGPVREPLKFIPQEATSVSVSGGMDFAALYKELLDFVSKDLPGGEEIVAEFERRQADAGWSIKDDVLSWLGTEYVQFTAPIPSTFMPGTVVVVSVKDEEKAKAAVDRVCARLGEWLTPRQGGVEAAKIEGVEGFKRVLLPPLFAMVPGIGRPIIGVKDGRLFIANGPEVLGAALKVAAGKREDFSKSARFAAEGLPLENVFSMSYDDLTGYYEQLGVLLPAMTYGVRMAFPDVAAQPGPNAALLVVTKVGNIAKKLDFYRSQCAVTSFDGKASRTKSVVHYQEPPKRTPASAPSRDLSVTTAPASAETEKKAESKPETESKAK